MKNCSILQTICSSMVSWLYKWRFVHRCKFINELECLNFFLPPARDSRKRGPRTCQWKPAALELWEDDQQLWLVWPGLCRRRWYKSPRQPRHDLHAMSRISKRTKPQGWTISNEWNRPQQCRFEDLPWVSSLHLRQSRGEHGRCCGGIDEIRFPIRSQGARGQMCSIPDGKHHRGQCDRSSRWSRSLQSKEPENELHQLHQLVSDWFLNLNLIQNCFRLQEVQHHDSLKQLAEDQPWTTRRVGRNREGHLRGITHLRQQRARSGNHASRK